MKNTVIALMAAAGLMLSSAALANEALAKKSGCSKCHQMEGEGEGPSYKDMAKKFKGKDEAAVVSAFKAKKDHAKVKASDDDLKAIAGWVLKL